MAKLFDKTIRNDFDKEDEFANPKVFPTGARVEHGHCFEFAGFVNFGPTFI